MDTISKELSLSHSQLGTLPFVRGACLLLTILLTGFLAGQFGKKPFFIAGFGFMALFAGLLYVSRTYRALLPVFGVLGAGSGFLEALANPLTAELYPEREASKLNQLNAFFPMGLIAASLGAGVYLRKSEAWRVPFLVLGGLSVLMVFLFFASRFPARSRGKAAAVERKESRKSDILDLIKSGDFWLLALAMTLTAGTEGGITYWGAKLIQDQYDLSLAGSFGLILFAAPMMLGRFFAARLLASVRVPVVLTAGCVLGIVGLTGIILLDNLVLNLACYVLCGLAIAPFWPTLLSRASQRVRPRSVTLLFAVMSASGIVGYDALPAVIGLFADIIGLKRSLFVLVISLAVVLLISLRDRLRTDSHRSTP